MEYASQSGRSPVGSPSKAELIAEVAGLRKEVQSLTSRRHELTALLQAHQTIVSSLDLEKILQAIVEHAAAISGCTSVRLFLLDEASRMLRCRVGFGLPAAERETLEFPATESLSGQVATTGTPLAVADIRGDPRLWRPELASKHGLVSYLGLPVKLASRILGVLIFSTPSPRTYSENEIGFLTGFAAHAAIAIENARLFAEAQRRCRQLEVVQSVTAEITRELDLTTLLAILTRRTIELFGATSGGVHFWDEAKQVVVPQAWSGYLQGWQKDVKYKPGEGVVGTVALKRQGLVVNDYRQSVYAHPLFVERTSITAVLAEPLLYQGRLLGVIAITHEEAGRTFTEEDRELLALFAGQAAITIENARLHTAAVRRQEEQEALLRATHFLMSGLDLQTILKRIVAEAAQISGSPHVKVLLVDREAGILRLMAIHGTTAMTPGFTLPLGTGRSGIVAATGQPIYSPNSVDDPHNALFADRDRELGIQTYLGLPIKHGDEVLGVLTFNTVEPREYSPEELTLLTSFADQAAIAIENARLYQAAQAELAERTLTEAALAARTHQLETVRTISEEIARELDLSALLTLIDQRAGGLVGADCGAIHLWDEDSQMLVTRAWHGYGAWRGDVRLRLGEGVSGAVAQRREGMIVNDYRTSPFAHSLFLEKTQTTSILCEPLLYRDRLLGVIMVTNDERHHQFTEEDRHLFRLFATQAAIAIENARLYAELNQSFQSLQRAQEELVRSEKLRALGQMAAGIAHDLNNMLAAILGQVELLQLRVADPEVRAGLATLETAAADGAHVVRRLQDFARQRAHSSLKSLDLRPVVAEALAITRPRWEDEAQRRGLLITVQTHLDDCPPILGQASEIREMLTNIILNAVDAMPHGGTLTLTAKQAGRSVSTGGEEHGGRGGGGVQFAGSRAAHSFVELCVTDTGIGMTEAVRQRIFEPFFTTKGGQGTGLGLSVVYGIMERHGGRIHVASSPGQGTTVSLRFAVASGEAAAAEARGSPASPQRVLLIDDDAMVRLTLASILQAAGHTVQEADGGAAGLDLFARVPVDLVLTDLGMPGVTGWDVARAVKARTPRLPIILLTGWGEQAAVEAGAEGLVERVLAKPVRMDDLLRVVADLTGSK
jgi:GAF domain-containing protein